MKRKTIRNIIILAAALLLSLITTQIVWVGKAFEFQEKQFNYDIKDALKNVAQQILKHKKDSSLLIDPVKQISSNQFNVSINDILHPYYLESLLNKEFGKHQIDLGYEYAIYDCFTDSVVFSKIVTSGNSSDAEMPNPAEMKWEKDGHYFSVYFPSKSQHLLKRMGFWIFSTTILFIVILFFVYTISIILKQKRISEIKNDFINNMTHELKTPISTISLACEALKDEEMNRNKNLLKRYINMIEDENKRLGNMVQNVLQSAVWDKGEFELKKESLNINALIKSVAEKTEIYVKEKQGRIILDLNNDHSMVIADKIHITNVLFNLLDNAIKYTPENPQISISTMFNPPSRINAKGEIIIKIKDNGIGLRKEDQKRVFEKLYRVPTGNIHNVKGFGLGLNYVKTIVEKHNGTVGVESEFGKGSCFYVKIPVS